MDVRDYVIGVLVLVLAAGAVFVFSGVEKGGVVENASGVQVFYLFPQRCVSCDLRTPGECDFCTSYYDDRVMGVIGQELGVELKFVVSDAVDQPNVFVVNGWRAGLIDAKSKYVIADGLCKFANVSKSCDALKSEVNRTRECVKRYSLTEDTLVYHYSTSGCIHCARTTPLFDDLLSESYNETYGYKVRKADDNNTGDRKMLDECFGSFMNLDYVPQVVCPRNGDSITGGIEKLSTLREFADKCIEAKK
ncbi:MAG: hypothetical protein NTU61_02645 [Candidatus Altiarchaeota archaeon]|nr:hypothetical protein [Candidatus Altiarchaeota archaeon]